MELNLKRKTGMDYCRYIIFNGWLKKGNGHNYGRFSIQKDLNDVIEEENILPIIVV